jgi:hypothetical protein
MIAAELIIDEAWYPSAGEFPPDKLAGHPLTVLSARVPLGPAEGVRRFPCGTDSPIRLNGMVYDEYRQRRDLMTVTASGTDELKLIETLIANHSWTKPPSNCQIGAFGDGIAMFVTLDTPGAQIARFTADTIPDHGRWCARWRKSIRKGTRSDRLCTLDERRRSSLDDRRRTGRNSGKNHGCEPDRSCSERHRSSRR